MSHTRHRHIWDITTWNITTWNTTACKYVTFPHGPLSYWIFTYYIWNITTLNINYHKGHYNMTVDDPWQILTRDITIWPSTTHDRYSQGTLQYDRRRHMTDTHKGHYNMTIDDTWQILTRDITWSDIIKFQRLFQLWMC